MVYMSVLTQRFVVICKTLNLVGICQFCIVLHLAMYAEHHWLVNHVSMVSLETHIDKHYAQRVLLFLLVFVDRLLVPSAEAKQSLKRLNKKGWNSSWFHFVLFHLNQQWMAFLWRNSGTHLFSSVQDTMPSNLEIQSYKHGHTLTESLGILWDAQLTSCHVSHSLKPFKQTCVLRSVV